MRYGIFYVLSHKEGLRVVSKETLGKEIQIIILRMYHKELERRDYCVFDESRWNDTRYLPEKTTVKLLSYCGILLPKSNVHHSNTTVIILIYTKVLMARVCSEITVVYITIIS